MHRQLIVQLCLPRQILQSLCMSPALPKSTVAQRYEHPDSQHVRISFRFGGRFVVEGAEAGIVMVYEVAALFNSALQW